MSPTRRHLLRATLPAAVGLAGCTETDGAAHPADDDPAIGRSRGTEHDPEVSKPRNLEGGPVLGERGDELDEPSSGIRRTLLTSQSDADDLVFGDGVPDDHVASTRAFFEETVFEEETIYVVSASVESCTQYRIRSVSWEPDRVEYEYCRELRPPEDDCTAAVREQVALCICLPEPLEMDIRSSGSSGRTPCQHSDTEYETIEPNATSDETEGDE